ncbi:MAG: hypothetical protein CVV60_02330 [Tenericutes bacterium HGW-Tenericutes-5]|jgi:hypothetical protein|nr:MAG: hypothetical protein CVV60_02330 [Tenericutes bacterium HGW-Tenericutes-5]
MLVRNIRGFESRRVPNNIESWLEYYNRNIHSSNRVTCSKCNGPAEVGAHVIKMVGVKEWYLVPLCKKCFEEEANFEVEEKHLVKVYLM